MARPQRVQVERAGPAPWSRRRRAGRRSRSMRRPATPSRAGSRVTAASTATATTTAVASPMAPTKGMPVSHRPRMAMTTVPPAKTTDWPAVALARPAASGTGARRPGSGGSG